MWIIATVWITDKKLMDVLVIIILAIAIYVYKTGKTSDQEILDELNGKVENVIQKCNGLAEFPEDDELEEELNEVQNRKRRRIVVG